MGKQKGRKKARKKNGLEQSRAQKVHRSSARVGEGTLTTTTGQAIQFYNGRGARADISPKTYERPTCTCKRLPVTRHQGRVALRHREAPRHTLQYTKGSEGGGNGSRC